MPITRVTNYSISPCKNSVFRVVVEITDQTHPNTCEVYNIESGSDE